METCTASSKRILPTRSAGKVPGFGGRGRVFRRGNFEFLSAIRVRNAASNGRNLAASAIRLRAKRRPEQVQSSPQYLRVQAV
jgi:hypothetical protein